MADYYSLIMRSIIFVQHRVQGKHALKLQLNEHQCMFMASKLLEVSVSLRNRDPEELKLVRQDVRLRSLLLHLHRDVRRAQILVERCCSECSSWLASAMSLLHLKEEVVVILLHLHQWMTMDLGIAITTVKGGSSGKELLNLVEAAENEHERLLEDLQSSQHELQIAADQDRMRLLRRITNFLETEGVQDEDDYLRAVYLKSQLSQPKGDLQGEKKLKLNHPDKLLLGTGSCSQIYKQNWLGLDVALKELNCVDKTGATLLSQIRHPNVVQFLHYWEDDEEQYHHSFIIMELMPTDLSAYMNNLRWSSSNIPFWLPVAIDIMLQVAEAMRHLHDRHLTHRNLRTSNILVKPVDESLTELCNQGYLEVKLGSFGLAKTYHNSSTSSPPTQKIGNHFYRAPEVFEDEDVRRQRYYPPKADVWSFGMTCFEILSGKLPFAGEARLNLHKRISTEGLRPTLPEDCPDYLKFCIASCWQLEPERRPSFNDLCRLLRCAKVLSVGMLHLDSTIISPLFSYQTRPVHISIMNIINSTSPQQCSTGSGGLPKSLAWKDEVPPDDQEELQHRQWIGKRKQGDYLRGFFDSFWPDKLQRLRSGERKQGDQGALNVDHVVYRHPLLKATQFSTNDDYASILQHSGIVKLREHDYEGALRVLNVADEHSPHNYLTLQQRGIVKLRLHDLIGALKDLTLANIHNLDNYLTLQQLGIVKLRLDDYKGALRDLDAADQCSPNDYLTLQQRGILKLKLSDYEGALRDLDGADKCSPGDCLTLQQRGIVNLGLGDYEGALRDLDVAFEYSPSDYLTLQQRGIVKFRLDDYEGALKDLDAAHKTSPSDYLSLQVRGMLKVRLGDYEGALKDLDAAHESSPTNYLTLQQRGMLKLRSGDYEGALSDLDAAHQSNPTDSLTLQQRGTLKLKLGYYEGALRDLDAAYEGNQDDFFTLKQRGIVKLKLGDYEGALKDLDVVHKSRLNDHLTLQYRGMVKSRLGDDQGALLDLDVADQISPNDYLILQERGFVKLRLDDYEGALQDLRAANDHIRDDYVMI